jgi:hypothetical protein
MSSGLSPRLSDFAAIRNQRAAAAAEPARARSPCAVRLAPTTRNRMTYTINLHQKLIWEAYSVHLAAWLSCPGGSTSAARPSTAGVSRPRRNRIRETVPAGKIRQTVPAGNGRGLRASIGPDIRGVDHEHRNAVKHVFQARFELPLPPVLGESRR